MITTIRGIDILNDKALELMLEDDLVISIKDIAPSVDLPFILPGGLIDTQVNGFLGFDYSDPDLKEESIEMISKSLLKEGTFQHFATIVTRPEEIILRNIERILNARNRSELVKKCITGIHIEGNFISSVDGPRGAHDRRFVRKASIDEFDRWYEHSKGLLKCITVGAEVEGIVELIKHAVSCGVTVALGHTGACKKDIERAVEAGASVSTHLGNGIWQSIDRFENPLWAQMRNTNLTASVIADKCHVTPDLLWIISRCKETDKTILVSDLAPCAGLEKGRHKWGSLDVEIVDDLSVRLAGTPFLAGAGSCLFNDVFNYSECTGVSLQKAFRMATINPARQYKLDLSRLKFEVGTRAEFVVFDNNAHIKCIYA